jgi:hypothetical protein
MARATPKKKTTTNRPDFARLAQEAIATTAHPARDLERYLLPVEDLNARYRVPYEPDRRWLDYSRDFTSTHLEVSHRIGQTFRDGVFAWPDRFLDPWLDLEPIGLARPEFRVYVPDRPGTTSPPDLRYKLEWTDMLPPLVSEFDPVAHATRWRDQDAAASKVQGTSNARSNTNGEVTDVQAGVGVLYQPSTNGGVFQFRPLVLWRSWVSISTDAPPIAPPWPIATAQSYGAVRMVAQSWRAADGGDFRTDAISTVDLWNYFTTTPNRIWAHDDSGIATPEAGGWIELPANRKRVYALWAIVRAWSKGTYAGPSLSSALGMGMCSIPFMIVEH